MPTAVSHLYWSELNVFLNLTPSGGGMTADHHQRVSAFALQCHGGWSSDAIYGYLHPASVEESPIAHTLVTSVAPQTVLPSYLVSAL